MRRFVLPFLLGASFIAGCGEASSPGDAPSASDEATEQSDTSASSDRKTVAKGEWGTSGGATVRIVSVDEASGIKYIGGTQTDVTPDGEAETKKAGSGAKYVLVLATIKNDGKQGIDLTCGSTVSPDLLDDEDRHFTVIQDLYLLKGNPECNSMLDPGFKDSITWAYRLPSDATASAIELIDNTDPNESGKPVNLSVN